MLTGKNLRIRVLLTLETANWSFHAAVISLGKVQACKSTEWKYKNSNKKSI